MTLLTHLRGEENAVRGARVRELNEGLAADGGFIIEPGSMDARLEVGPKLLQVAALPGIAAGFHGGR